MKRKKIPKSANKETFELMLMSEKSLAKEWNEDKVWDKVL